MKKVKAIRFAKELTSDLIGDQMASAGIAPEWYELKEEADGFIATMKIPNEMADNWKALTFSEDQLLFEEPDPIDPVDDDLADAVLDVVENPIGILEPRILALIMERITPLQDGLQIRKGYDAEVQKDAGNNGRIRMRMTSDSEDRMGDVIAVDGWVYDNYKRNPIILFNHDYGEVGGSPPSQGRSLAITTRKHAVENDIEFHRKTRFNEELYSMYSGGFMKTGSVGFWPLARPEERKASNERTGLKFTKQDLLEFSLVAVPANPDAYQLAMKKGLLRPKAAEYLVSTALSFAASTDKGKNRKPTAAPGRNAEQEIKGASLAAAMVRLRARLTTTILKGK